ncbi:hypothetical protein OAV62_02055 [bacterium]|nr:hypothetical protein [bacterium]
MTNKSTFHDYDTSEEKDFLEHLYQTAAPGLVSLVRSPHYDPALGALLPSYLASEDDLLVAIRSRNIPAIRYLLSVLPEFEDYPDILYTAFKYGNLDIVNMVSEEYDDMISYMMLMFNPESVLTDEDIPVFENIMMYSVEYPEQLPQENAEAFLEEYFHLFYQYPIVLSALISYTIDNPEMIGFFELFITNFPPTSRDFIEYIFTRLGRVGNINGIVYIITTFPLLSYEKMIPVLTRVLEDDELPPHIYRYLTSILNTLKDIHIHQNLTNIGMW